MFHPCGSSSEFFDSYVSSASNRSPRDDQRTSSRHHRHHSSSGSIPRSLPPDSNRKRSSEWPDSNTVGSETRAYGSYSAIEQHSSEAAGQMTIKASSITSADAEIDIDFVDKLLTESIRLKKKCKVNKLPSSSSRYLYLKSHSSSSSLVVVERTSQRY
jgi:hypothetical protein